MPSLPTVQTPTDSPPEPAIFGYYRDVYDAYAGDKDLIRAGIIAAHESGFDTRTIPSVTDLEDLGRKALGRPDAPPAPAPEPERGFFGEAASALGAGVASTLESVTGAMEMAGLEAGRIGREYYENLGQSESLRRPAYLQQDTVKEHPERLMDWRWWTRSLGENLPNMAAMFLPGLGAMKAAQAAGWGMKAILTAGKIGYWSGATAVEAGSAYNQAKQDMRAMKGFDPDEIERIATAEGMAVGIANGILEVLPFAGLISRPATGGLLRRVMKRIVRQALAEGTTETAQEAVNVLAEQMGHKPDEKWSGQIGRLLESGIIGAALGGVVAPFEGEAVDAIARDAADAERAANDQGMPDNDTMITEIGREPRLKDVVERRTREQRRDDVRKRAEDLLGNIIAEERQQDETAVPGTAQAGAAPTQEASTPQAPEPPGPPSPPEEGPPNPPGAPALPTEMTPGPPGPRSGGVLVEDIPAETSGPQVRLSRIIENPPPVPVSKPSPFGKLKGALYGKKGRLVQPPPGIPEFTGTEEAQAFGKKATPEQVAELERRYKEIHGKVKKLTDEGKVDEAMRLGTEGQRYNEALAAAKEGGEQKKKEPWEMTPDEYVGGETGIDAIAVAKAAHPMHVKEAIKRGEDVPRKVLEAYRHNVWAQKAIAELDAKAAAPALPKHAIRKVASGAHKGEYMAWVVEGPHKDTVAYGNTRDQARKALKQAVDELGEAVSPPARTKPAAKNKGAGVAVVTGKRPKGGQHAGGIRENETGVPGGRTAAQAGESKSGPDLEQPAPRRPGVSGKRETAPAPEAAGTEKSKEKAEEVKTKNRPSPTVTEEIAAMDESDMDALINEVVQEETEKKPSEKELGVNEDGNPVYADKDGNRYYVENGVRVSAPRPLMPTGKKMPALGPKELFRRGSQEYLTREEIAEIKKERRSKEPPATKTTSELKRELKALEAEIKKKQGGLPVAEDMIINDHGASYRRLTGTIEALEKRAADIRKELNAKTTQGVAAVTEKKRVASETGKTEATAGELAKRFAKEGITGIDEALTGLVKLFGGVAKVGPAFDPETYAKAKPHFEAALQATLDAGKTARDLVRLLVKQFGAAIAPYVKRFMVDIKSGELTKPEERVSIKEEAGTVKAKGGVVHGDDLSGTQGNEAGQRGGAVSRNEPVLGSPHVVSAGELPGADQGAVRAGETEGGTGTGSHRSNAPSGGTGGVRKAGPGPDSGARVRGPGGAAERTGGPAGSPETAAPGGTTGNPPVERGSEQHRNRLTPEDRNHVIQPADILVPKGPEQKIRANIAAIQLIKQLEQEDRNPTPKEKTVLARFVGWGAFAQKVFNRKFDKYVTDRKNIPPEKYFSPDQLKKYLQWEKKYGKRLHPALGGLLTRAEWDHAAESTLNAHYTSRTVINAMWRMAARLGFTGGDVLEPSAGVGHFFGLMPQDMAGKSNLSAVELDDITGAILKRLYPQAHVEVTGFEKSKIPDNSMDLVISNFPFGNFSVYDSRHKAYRKWSIHNYFFGRSIDAVRPGGLVIGITSHYTLDAKTGGPIREAMAKKADLVAAIRLPKTAFSKNAGTEVTTDILIFRKKDGSPFRGADFRVLKEVPADKNGTAMVNEYFADHPEMVLGEHSLSGTMRGGGEEYTLLPKKGEDLAGLLDRAIERLPAGVTEAGGAAAPKRVEYAETGAKENVLIEKDGRFYVVKDGRLEEPTLTDTKGEDVPAISNKSRERRARDYLKLREATKHLIDRMQQEDATDEEIRGLQANLNALYDAFVKKNNFVTAPANSFLRKIDNEFPIVAALERETRKSILDPKAKNGTRTIVKTFKSDIFTRRTIFPFREPDTAENAADALKLSRIYRNRVDIDFMAGLLGKDPETLRREILASGLVFENPETGILEPPDVYLSGNVKKKLDAAKARLPAHPEYEKNISALEAVQPDPLDIEFIYYRLGSSWLPGEVIQDFLRDVMGVEARVRQSRTMDTSTWGVEAISGQHGAKNTDNWGTGRVTGLQLVKDCLNLKRTQVYDSIPAEGNKTRRVLNKEETLAAQEKQKEIQAEFVRWSKSHKTWARKLEDIYNTDFNGFVLRTFDVPDIERFPGASRDITLRPLQKRMVSRGLQESTLFAYGVGTGKTFGFISLAMEMRRIGTARKPLIVVHNSTVSQYRDAFLQLYPQAKVLVPDHTQRAGKNRKQLLTQIATGDWDAVVLPHSFFDGIADDPEREAAFVQEQLDLIEEAIDAATEELGANDFTVKDMKALRRRKEARLAALLDRRKDDALTFEQLGVDAILVDEAHNYKRSDFFTKMGTVKGIDQGASQRSTSLLLKARYVQGKTGGKNVILATGTPISNTTAELWTMLRYIRPDLLKEYNAELFDDFAANFGDTSIDLEETETGTFKEVERFNKYVNGPELLTMFHTAADVVLTQDADLNLPAIQGGKPESIVIPRSKALGDFIETLRQARMRWDNLSGKEKRAQRHVPLVLFGLAKKAAVDLRLVDPEYYKDDPDSKINRVIRNTHDIWKETAAERGTQIIFLDIFRDSEHIFDAHREIRKKLVELGIPRNEILVIDDANNDAQREAQFEQIRTGAARVIIGSTTKLGIGVNIQNRCAAAHHVDAPPRPMDIEQRNGRIVREGNRFKTVRIYNYGVKGTLDSVMYDRLTKKQRFYDQVLKGDLEGRTFDEPLSDEMMSFAEMNAAFADNPLLFEQNDVVVKIRKLEIMKQNAVKAASKARRKVRELREVLVPDAKAAFKKAVRLRDLVLAYLPDGKIGNVRYGKKELSKKEFTKALSKDWDHALDEIKKVYGHGISYGKAMEKKAAGVGAARFRAEAGGLSIVIEMSPAFKKTGYWEDLKPSTPVDLADQVADVTVTVAAEDEVIGMRTLNTAAGAAQSIENMLGRVIREPETRSAVIGRLEKEIDEYKRLAEKKFEREDELKALKQRRLEIERELSDQVAPATEAAAGAEAVLDRTLNRTEKKVDAAMEAAAASVAGAGEPTVSEKNPKPVYYRLRKDGEFVPSDGRRVEIVPWLETFAVKNTGEFAGDRKWDVIEAETGLSLISGSADTRVAAVAKAREQLEKYGETAVMKLLDQAIEKHGRSPYAAAGETRAAVVQGIVPGPGARMIGRREFGRLKALLRDVRTWLKEVLPPEVYDRVALELKPVISLKGKNIEKTLAEHGEIPVDRIIGATTINRINALVELSYEYDKNRIQAAAYHEAFHVVAAWLLPEADYRLLMRHYKTEEKAADAFARFAMGKKQATGYAANPGGIRRIFARIRKVLAAIRNGLAGKGFRDPRAVFEKIWTRAYSPAPVSRGDRTAIAFGGRGQMSLFSMAGERPQPAAPHTRFSVLNEEADVPDSGPGLTAELKKNRTFVNKLFEMSDLARHRIGVETAKLQEQVQKLAGKASRRKLTLGFAYKPDLKRSMASDQLDRAMMVYRDLQANPEKADEFKAWADRKLSDPKTPGKQKIVIRRELKLLDAALALTPEQKAFVDEMARRFEDGFKLANKFGLIRTHRDHYVRRIWRLPAGKEDLFQGTGSGYGFKTFTTAAKERSFDTILDGWMNGYELAVAGITNSYYAYMTELATVMANRAFIRRGVATKDLDGNPMFSTDPLAGYKPLKAAGFSVWRWKGMAAAEAKLDDKEALIINTYGRKFFATIPERIPEMWAVYKDADAKRALKLFDDETAARDWAAEKGYDRIEYRPPHDVSQLFEKQPLYAPAPVADMINRMTATDALFTQTPAAKALLRLNTGIKAYILLSSFFHHLAGSRSWIFGVHHGWKGVNPVAAYKAGLKKIEDLHPLIDFGVRHGLTLGVPQDWSENLLREDKGLTEALVHRLGLEKAAGAIEKGKFYREKFTDSLFKKFFAGLKAEAFVVEYTHELQKAQEKYAAGKLKSAPDPDLIAEQMATLINADFGELHLKRMGRNPTLQKLARLILLAPDWTESNFRTVTGMIPGLNKWIDKMTGGVPAPPGMDRIYRKFWGRVALRIAVATIIAQLLLNGKDDSEEFIKEQMLSNRFNKLRWTEIDITRLYRMLGIDTEGQRKTFSIGGHFFDPLKLIDPWRLIKAKGSPVTRIAGALGTGTDWAGRPFTGVSAMLGTRKTVKKSAYEDVEGAFNRLPATIVNQVINMQPIQLGHLIRYWQGEEDGLSAIMSSAGAAVHTAWRPRMTEPVIRPTGASADAYAAVKHLADREVLNMGPPARTLIINGIGRRMTREQYERYLEESSVIALRKIAALVRGAMWTRIPPEEQARRVAAIIRNARKRVRGRIKRMMVTPHKTARAA